MVKKSTSKKAIAKKSVRKPAVKKATLTQAKAEQTAQVKTKQKKIISKPRLSQQPRRSDQTTLASDETAGYGFFDDQSAATGQARNQPMDSTLRQPDETAAYGFFDEHPAVDSVEAARPEAACAVIDLGTDLTIRSITRSKAMIDQALATEQDLRIDISQLQKIDSAGVQMLHSLLKTLEKTSRTAFWIGHDRVLNDAARALGLPVLLDDQQAAARSGFFGAPDGREK